MLRHLTGEPEAQAAKAGRLFEALEAGSAEVFLEDVVLAELVWTLSTYYKRTREQVSDLLDPLLALECVINSDKDSLKLAMTLFRSRNLDFADALLAARTLRFSPREIISFDHDFDRISGLTRKEPGEP